MLIECPECKRQISDTAASCPCCGWIPTKTPTQQFGRTFFDDLSAAATRFGKACVRAWAALGLIARILFVVLLLFPVLIIGRLKYLESTNAWREVNEYVTTGDVKYKILYEKDEVESMLPWSGPRLRWQTVVINPEDRTKERLRALDQQLRRDNAGIWSICIYVYDDETAARMFRERWQINNHYVGTLDHVDGVGEEKTLDENAGY